MGDYIEYDFRISPLHPASDILVAELGEAGFESFVESGEGLKAYIQESDWHKDILRKILILENSVSEIQFSFKIIPQENWNANWERSFEPIRIDDQCTVRAPFHEKPEVGYDIVIEPKMSFGTGHHETTHMMLQFVLEQDLHGMSVLDMGSGTGVLAILAAKKGATHIDAIDIDNWCYLNAKENALRNDMAQINVYEGDAGLLGEWKYDLIMANINRNILMEDIPLYAQNLTEKGILLVSGFYSEDLPLISEKCKKSNLKFKKKREKNQWVAAKYVF